MLLPSNPPRQLHKFIDDVYQEVMRPLHQALSMNLDFLSEKDHAPTLLKGAALGKCLSVQNLLRSPANEETRTLSGKLAWCILSIRSAAYIFLQTFRNNQPPEPGMNLPPCMSCLR